MPEATDSIREIHFPARDTFVIGDDTPERIVPGSHWPGLRARGISFVGLTDGGAGYEMARPAPPTAHLLVCHGGQGEVAVDGRWRVCRTGDAYLSPPLAPMAFRTVPRHRWQFAWVYLLAKEGERPPISGHAATLIHVDPRQMINAVEGLYLEASGAASAERLDLWAQLLGEYVHAITRSAGRPDPLWRLWAQVDASLSENWTLEDLAEYAKLRPEALRRLCLRQTGRSPMRQVTHLRMRRAEALLRSTSSKLFAVARQVGYDNTFAFSTAFRRWKGVPPNDCRGRDD